jgi:hypothetical protein
MTDAARCVILTFGCEPFVSEQALRQVDAFLADLDLLVREKTLNF